MTANEITQSVARQLAEKIVQAGRASASEQALVIAVSTALDTVLEQLGIPKRVEYEKVLLGGRADAVYGSVIIEYEAPGKLATAPGRAEAFGQARQYMREQAELRSPGAPEEALPKLVGVVLDGRQIGFVLWRPGGEPDAEIFEMRSRAPQLSFEPEFALAGRFQELGLFAVSESGRRATPVECPRNPVDVACLKWRRSTRGSRAAARNVEPPTRKRSRDRRGRLVDAALRQARSMPTSFSPAWSGGARPTVARRAPMTGIRRSRAPWD